MLLKHSRVIGVVLLLNLLFGAGLARADSAESLVNELSSVASLSGSFTQQQYGNDGSLLQESSGTFVMQRPQMLRWETTEPFPQLLVTDGATVWLYDPDLEQVTISRLDQQISSSPAVILSGDLATIRRHYTVSGSKGSYLLRPIDDQAFTELRLTFRKQMLASMELLDSLGQTTRFVFSGVQASESQPQEYFTFEPPPGSDILINE
ncbi:outer membrane lipoprotein chaperone LolA [Pseudomaricurvus sp. HS19]|uniref:outer membrane lipoprotein chaperone LolA n=1 Tax=Pseudomaricurvus sp. HS19 TaxID=2692626 RepID=UPI001371C009|nr:outer membrane lipoprotein chaperone LolA [Pseudomaricurvus sp. HS19]MYM62227.1 outer membrane lipoprotein chaperone LolA [Pseudomaricurvus sp. HS19]